MRLSLVVSLLLHAAVILVGYFGLPTLRRPLPEETPIIVELAKDIPVSEITNLPPVQKPEPKKEEPKKEPPKQETKPAPPPPPPPSPPPEPDVAALAPPPPEPKKEAKKEPEPKKDEPKKEEPKPKAPPRLAEARPKQKPKPPDPFASVLKTVEQMKTQAPRKPEPPDPKKKPKDDFSDQIASAIGAGAARGPYRPDRPLSVSEEDALKRAVIEQLTPCWNIPAGAKDVHNMTALVKVQLNPDGSVRDARIVDWLRMQTDPFFRAFAESALRAVLNPRCTPLKLPADKYAHWKDMEINFDPRELF